MVASRNPKVRSLRKRIEAAKKRAAPFVGDMDPGDFDLIVSSLMRPFGSGRRFFLRQIRPRIYVF